VQPTDISDPFNGRDHDLARPGDAMRKASDEEFQDFVRRRRTALLSMATVMTGGDRHLAEDLVQVCLTKLYLAWPRVRAMKLDGYARRVLVNALIDDKRGPVRRREQAWAEVPDRPQSAETDGDRYGLLEAIGQLPPGMRAAVVLRHVEGLSTEETADALRCSTGTVKSQTARGLARLRDLVGDPNHTYSGGTE
jgi:RNA polymerase sigma-70 factor (sigma-E family)